MDTFNPGQMPPRQDQAKKSVGPLAAVIIILVLIIIGGLYFLNKERSSREIYTPTSNSDNITESLKQQSNSDNLDSIETDLKAIDLNNLDQGAAAIETQLQ